MKKILLFLFLSLICSFAFADSYTPNTTGKPLVIQQGEDFVKRYQIRDKNKKPVNLTGYSFKAQGKKAYTDASPFINFSTSVFSNQSGIFLLSVPKRITSKYPVTTTGYWDLQMKFPDGSITYLIKNTFSFSPTVTH